MKRTGFAVIVLCAVLLAGCSDSREADFLKFMESVSEAESISFTADVRAEYEDKTADFKFAYEQDSQGSTIEVLEPELIAGIKAHTDSDSVKLEYDGAVLDIGKLTDDGLTPMSALPILADAMKNAHLDLTWEEDGLLAAGLIYSDELSISLKLDGESLVPVSAEINYDDDTVVFITVNDWKIE